MGSVIVAATLGLAACGSGPASTGDRSEGRDSSLPRTTAPEPTTTPPGPTTTPPSKPSLRSVAVLGDSMSAALAAPLRAALASDECHLEWHWCVGFLVPSSAEVWAEVVTARQPDVVVLFFAPWENEKLRDGEVIDPTDPAWPELYRREFVQPWIELARSGRSHLVWVAMPQSRDAALAAEHAEFNAIWAEVVAGEPSMSWVDGAAILAAPDGSFAEIDSTVDPPVRLINVDGMHICPHAAERLAGAVLAVVGERFEFEVRAGWRLSGWEQYPDAFGPGCPVPDAGERSPASAHLRAV